MRELLFFRRIELLGGRRASGDAQIAPSLLIGLGVALTVRAVSELAALPAG